MNSSQFMQSFHQTHDQNTKKFKFGMVVEVEKQAKQRGSMILRQVRLEEQHMQQVNNQKNIPYPNNFNMITKDVFDNLPQNEKAFFPWTNKPNKNVRVFFDRLPAGLNRTIMTEFAKPTAVYFDDVQSGKRFIEFLKFRSQQKLERCKTSLLKIKQKWLYKVFLLHIQKSNTQLKETAQKMSDKHKLNQNNSVKNSQEIQTFDFKIYKQMFQKLLKFAQNEQIKEKERIRQGKINKLKQHQKFIEELEKRQLKILAQKWLGSATAKFEEEKERERLEQEALEEEERKIQKELEEIDEKQRRLSQIPQPQPHIEKQYKNLHVSKLQLIIDSHIRLLNPVLFIQFKPIESGTGSLEFVTGGAVTFLNLNVRSWSANVEMILSSFQLQDILEFIIYDDYQELTERLLAKAQEEQNAQLAFLATAKKMMQGRVTMLEFQKNLNNNRRHFVRLDVSAELQRDYFSNQQLNIPMIQIDLHEDSPFQITNSTINPYYLDIIELPITAKELKYYIRQLKNPCFNLQQQWEQFKVKALEDALQARGQIWANSKWSEDYIVELLEYLLEEGFDYKEGGKLGPLHHYLCHNKIQEQQNLVKTNLILASMRGFSKQTRIDLWPALLQFSVRIKQFAESHQIEWHENISILDKVTEMVHQYTDPEQLQINKSKVEQYIDNIKFKYNTVWTEQFLKKLHSWKERIERIVNGCGLIDNTQDKLIFIVRLFQLMDGRQDSDEIIYKIIRCLSYELLLPKMHSDKLNLKWFKPHLSNVFSEYFYFDVWLRVFDYIVGIGFVYDKVSKAVASVVGGILNQMNSTQYRTQEEFIVGLHIYGRLLCDPEQLIKASYECFMKDEFQLLDEDDNLVKQLVVNGNPLEQIITDQQNQLRPRQQSYIIDVPEEHEGSIYDVQESQIVLPKASHKFVFKQRQTKVFFLIHQMYLHQTTFCDQNKVTVNGVHKLESEGLYYEIPIQSYLLDIDINEQFRGQLDLRYFLVNQIYKGILVLNDNYDMERHYQISEIEYSILVQGDGQQSEPLDIKDPGINYFVGQSLLFGANQNAFSHPDSWKQGNVLNYVEFKQLMINFFKLEPAQHNLQELYQNLRLQDNSSVYLIDILMKLAKSEAQVQEVLNLFLPTDVISHPMLRRFHIEEGDVKFLKVLISDENYEQSVDLTDYFNEILQNNLIKYNSYDILMVDQNNRLYLLDNAGSFNQLKSQMLILRMKYSSYGSVRKVHYQISRQFKLAKELQTQASTIQELLENNTRILSLDCKTSIKRTIPTNFQQLVYLRCRDGAKQLETCTVVGQILNKANELQYYVIELDDNKKVIVYKEDVLLFDEIKREELQVFEKVWKLQ